MKKTIPGVLIIIFAFVFHFACPQEIIRAEERSFLTCPQNTHHPNHWQWRDVERAGTTLEAFTRATSHAKQLKVRSKSRNLPDRLDNSVQPYFRGIFSQVHGSCSQASGVGYIFTYEIDWARAVTADNDQSRYPSHFTYNFLNNGQNFASDPFDGWNLVQNLGVPDQETFGGLAPGSSFTRWMDGYDNYFTAMHNRIHTTHFVYTDTEEGLESLKEWFDNHAMGADVGGLALFGANTIDSIADVIPAGTPQEGQFLIKQWGPPGQFLVDHLMTFVGYDDSICYDYNGDGQYTNDRDTNADGIVDMTDWEIGALIIANSWGTDWANNGFIYLPYRLLAIDVQDAGIGLFNKVFFIDTLAQHAPLVTMKISLTHDCRNRIRVTAGVARGHNATEPDLTFQPPIVNFQGGPNYMLGGTDETDKTMEFGIDVSPLLDALDSGEPATFFLDITERDNDGSANGTLNTFSLMDCTGSSPVETVGSSEPVELVDNGVTRLTLDTAITFNAPMINTEMMPPALEGQAYHHQLTASGGAEPFNWFIDYDYDESTGTCSYPAINQHMLTPVPNDDDGVAELALGFDFPFFLETINTVYITTDGSITFDENFTVIRSKGNLRNNKGITPLGADLQISPDLGQGIYYEKHADHVIIRWIVGRYSEPDAKLDFAAILHQSGQIDFCYGQNLDAGFNFAVGISDGAGHHNVSDLSGATTIPDNHLINWQPCDFIAHPVYGMTLTTDGVFQGVPTEAHQAWKLPISVIDAHQISREADVVFMCSSGAPFYTLNLQDSHLTAGETFQLCRVLGNPDLATISGTEYLALEVYGLFWFWPSWSQEVDSAPLTVAGPGCDLVDVLEFEWPQVDGTADNLRFWGALITTAGDLVDYTMIEWNYY